MCLRVYNYVCEFLPTVMLMLFFALSNGTIMFLRFGTNCSLKQLQSITACDDENRKNI